MTVPLPRQSTAVRGREELAERLLAPITSLEAFELFLECRPDDERWELIDGVPELNATPANIHQIIVSNLVWLLINAADSRKAGWYPLPGFGVPARREKLSLLVPDVVVRPLDTITAWHTDDAIVAFEVTSPRRKSRDIDWKREAYRVAESLTDYVVIEHDRCCVHHTVRARGWATTKHADPDFEIALQGLGVALSLRDIYRRTPFA